MIGRGTGEGADPPPAGRAILLVGNAVALVLVGLLFASGPRLFGPDAETARGVAGGVSTGATSASGTIVPGPDPDPAVAPNGARLLFVVVDALREDTARDRTQMPALAALADRGARASGRIDLLVPSTVGAIGQLVEGRPPPPVAALGDFGAPPAAAGGWIEGVVDAGGEVFVAGPDLWTERYGAWIGAAHGEAGMPSARSDERVGAAARRALGAADPPRVVVAHLAELDAVAHRHGANGPAWRAAARRVDARLGELVGDVVDERAVVVVADHGVTLLGGHAGGEEVVRRVPIVLAALGPGAAPVTLPCPRMDPHRLVDAVLAAPPSGARLADACLRSEGGDAFADAPPSPFLVPLVGGAAVAIVGAPLLASAFAPGFLLSGSLWIAIGLAVSGRVGAGAAFAAGAVVLAAAAAAAARWRRDARAAGRRARAGGDVERDPVRRPVAAAVAAAVVPLVVGAALALAAVGLAVAGADVAPPPVPWLVAIGVLVGAVAGAAGGTLRSPSLAGLALAVAIALAVHAGGESVSLSSVDVRLAHRVAGLAPGPPGIALAAPVALVRLALPLAAALLGFAIGRAWRRRRGGGGRSGGRRAGGAARAGPPSPDHLSGVAVAFGLCQLGAAIVYALCLSRPFDPVAAGALPLAAAGLGGLLRECVSCVLVFGTLAAFAARRARAHPEAEPCRACP